MNRTISKLFNSKKKRNILAVVLVALVGVIGITFAYFSTTSTFKNLFKTPPFNVTVYEIFESPDNWTPGMTTPKEVYATNNSDVNVGVRISYVEEWIAADGSELPLEQDGNRAAIINLANTSDWTEDEGYYYYNELLGPSETTSSFMESVTFNPEIVSTYTCTTNEEGHSECTSTGTGYDGATYTLTITIEMYQDGYVFEEEEYVCPSPDSYMGEDLIGEDHSGTVVNDDYVFSVDSATNQATIIAYTGPTGANVNIIIPKTINDVPVTVIGSEVFKSKEFGEIIISPSITTIASNAFYSVKARKLNLDYAVNLEMITGFPSATFEEDIVIACSTKATSIQSMTMLTAPKLILKNLPNLTSSSGCNGMVLDELNISNSGIVEMRQFQGSSIKKLVLQDLESLTTIESINQNVMEELVLDNLPKLEEIPMGAFVQNKITEITLEDLPSLKTIGDNAFGYNSATKIILRNLDSLETIGLGAFVPGEVAADTLILENLPNLKIIKQCAFENQKISNLTIKGLNSLETIGPYAFRYNMITSLTFDEMPNVTNIETAAFNGNPLETLDFTAATKLIDVGDSFVSTKTLEYVTFEGLKQDIDWYSGTAGGLVKELNLTGVASNDFVSNVLNFFSLNDGKINLSNSEITKFNYYKGDNVNELVLKGSANITDIIINGTNISSLDFDGMTSLKTIRFNAVNNLTSINFGSSASSITSLSLYPSNLTVMDLGDLVNLTELNFGSASTTKFRIPASVTTLTGKATSTVECVEILGDSTRFDEDFEDLFGVAKSSVASTCTFE